MGIEGQMPASPPAPGKLFTLSAQKGENGGRSRT